MASHRGDQISLALQFVASLCWAVGALLAGPASAADVLQLMAAVAWCLANCFAAWAMLRPLSGSAVAARPEAEADKR